MYRHEFPNGDDRIKDANSNEIIRIQTNTTTDYELVIKFDIM